MEDSNIDDDNNQNQEAAAVVAMLERLEIVALEVH